MILGWRDKRTRYGLGFPHRNDFEKHLSASHTSAARMRTKSRRALLRAWIGAAALLGLSAVATHANVLISIDKSTQQMLLSVDGVPQHRWAVSTGRVGYGTPSGSCVNPSIILQPLHGLRWMPGGRGGGYLTEDVV